MKTARLLMMLVLMLAFALPLAAQDDAEMAGATVGTMVQNAETAQLVLQEDDTYLLTLTGVDDYTPIVITQPDAYMTVYGTNLLVDDWSFTDNVQASALLQLGPDLTAYVTLSPEGEFDPESGTVRYILTFDNAISQIDDESFNPVNTFEELGDSEEIIEEAVTLVILADEGLLTALSDGRAARIEATRPTGNNCNPYISTCS